VERLKASERFRAVTLDPGARVRFTVPDLERVTGSSGSCIEESLDSELPGTLVLHATCAGLRTTLAWKKDGTRVSLMACAEDEDRPEALVKVRKQVQQALKRVKTATACVRNGRVEVWGWVTTEPEKKQIAALEKKYGLDTVRSHVELLEDED